MLIKKLGRVLAAFALVTMSVAGSLGAQSAVAPAAQAEASPSDPSIRGVHLQCGGAEAYVSVRWWDSEVVTVNYTITNTNTSDGLTPKIQFTAHNTTQAQSYGFDGSGWKVMPLTDGEFSGSFGSWNPSEVGYILDLAVTLKNGLDSESGTKCTSSKQIWNWGENALRMAQLQGGTEYALTCQPYQLIDCSCLVQWSFSQLSGFGTPPRDSRSQKAWLADLASDGVQTKVDAIQVSIADIQQGDLIFFDWESNDYIDHVAFYWSEGYVYDARNPDTTTGVHAQQLRSSEVVAIYRVTGVS